MADVVALVVRFFHIAFGIAWIGAVFYAVGVLRRVMPRVDPTARKATMKHLIPVVVQYLPGAAVMTILTGAILYLVVGQFSVAYMTGSPWGLTVLAALLVTLATFGYGMVFGVGTAKKILSHLNEEQCGHGTEVGSLTNRFNQTQVVVLVLGIVIIAMMVLATTHAL